MMPQYKTINCKGRLVVIDQPLIMAILNVTPDSFYDGGHSSTIGQYLEKVESFVAAGASIIDVGGMSSRPGAKLLSADEEWNRVAPVLKATIQRFPDLLISIDTIWADVAEKACEAGAHIINDISAGRYDPNLAVLAAEREMPYILMHMQGDPANMQERPQYQNVIEEVLDFFVEKIALLREKGVKDILIDPGFGFGKTVEQNYQLLDQMHVFKMFSYPIMVGLSRKSMICKVLQVNPSEALNGTSVLHMIALQQGASLLRVHDVRACREVIQLWEQLNRVQEKLSL